jgi:DNA repair exonuclease SbcCD nuclease subunit
MAAVGTNLTPSLAWVKVPAKDDEPGYSVMLRPDAQPPEAVAERIREALEGMVPAEPVVAPENVMADLCAFYMLMDAHVGMLAWGRETGSQDYDLEHAAKDMRHAFAKVLALTPAAEQAVLLIGGDFFHSDDTRAETPANRHKLDVDGRFWKIVDVGIGIIAETVARLLTKHAKLHVRVLRGNHDPHSSMTLNFALAERYRNEPRVMVEKEPRDLFMMQWGKCAIFAHHGDKGKPQQMALYLSDVCPFWSQTRHRHYLTGHVHHDQAKDLGPLRYESLRAFCPPDAYAAGMGYGARRALQSITFHKQDGLVLRALDPIDRDER